MLRSTVIILWIVCSIQAISLVSLQKQSPFQIDSESITRQDFDIWLSEQKDIAFKNILKNIGGISPSLNTTLVPEGVVIASPSSEHPNYFYQWVRDSALTIRSLIYHLDDSKFDDLEISKTIEAYIANNHKLQRLPNLSGSFDDDYSGLGEPKFHADLTAFNEHWGRPQRDGPGLRASTITSYLNVLEKYGKNPSHKDLSDCKYVYSEIIKPDLLYIVKNWNKSGFDLWEEIDSNHFFTSITSLRAIQDGIILYKRYDNEDDQFFQQLESTYTELKNFIENDSGFQQQHIPYIVECPQLLKEGKRSGLDAATLLGSLHSHSLENKNLQQVYEDIPFDIDDSHIINSFRAMVADMKYRYPVNRFRTGFGVGLGRYPEDIYDGYATSEGNPWFISTASASEILYKIVFKLNSNGDDLVITKSTKEFFSQFIDLQDSIEDVVIQYGSEEYEKVTLNLMEYADSFLAVIKDHVDNSGRMSEQFNKYDGFMQGAEDLTWSYSAVWNCIRWRGKALAIL
ncbi:hypothetical protein CAAN1_04S07382 [[Candida] anglica]|uniref:glucan 1,4-alpha-glucosidase n=1 Tax=[Candida] anglica TaxID=148631 RepID=A0ABP0E9N1_9ASCO